MRPSNERHPGSERGLRRVCPPLRYVSSGAQIRANSHEIAEFQDRTLPLAFSAGFSRVGRPNLAYGYTFLARQEPQKSCIGNKDLAPFWRFCCGLLILIVKDEEFVLVNDGRTVITFTPGSYVLYIPKNRLWGPKNGPGAVSRRPETPRNSRTLRDRSRGAFFVIVIAPGPMLFFGPFNACVLSVILMHWCAFGDLYCRFAEPPTP